MRRFAASIGYAFEVKAIEGGAKGLCNRRRREVTVEEVGDDFSPNAQIAAGVHELAHALVVVDLQKDDPKLSYAEEEVVVECVAYTVCASLGLDISDSSANYMMSWGKGGEIELYAALIDRLARRLEETLLSEGARDEQADPASREMMKLAMAA